MRGRDRRGDERRKSSSERDEKVKRVENGENENEVRRLKN